MSKNIGPYKLPDEIVKLMKDKIDDTDKTKREIGFILYKNTNNILSEGTQCVGNRCYIPQIIHPKCNNPKDKVIGLFHTHPKGNDISGGDFATACILDIFCLGTKGRDDRRINCYLRKSNKDECLKDAAKINKERKELDEMDKTLESMEPEAEKEFEKYNELIHIFNDRVQRHYLNFRDVKKRHFDKILIK